MKASAGQHWFCVYRSFEDEFYFVDSLATSVAYIQEHFSSLPLKHCSFNSKQLMPSNSIYCGQFAVYTGLHLITNDDMSLSQMLNHTFSSNLEANEAEVLGFFKD